MTNHKSHMLSRTRTNVVALCVSLALTAATGGIGYALGKRARLAGPCGPVAVRQADGGVHLVCDAGSSLAWQGTASGVLIWCGCGPAMTELQL